MPGLTEKLLLAAEEAGARGDPHGRALDTETSSPDGYLLTVAYQLGILQHILALGSESVIEDRRGQGSQFAHAQSSIYYAAARRMAYSALRGSAMRVALAAVATRRASISIIESVYDVHGPSNVDRLRILVARAETFLFDEPGRKCLERAAEGFLEQFEDCQWERM